MPVAGAGGGWRVAGGGWRVAPEHPGHRSWPHASQPILPLSFAGHFTPVSSPYARLPCPVRSVPMRGIELLGVPSAAGTHGPGQEDAPAWMRDAGLLTGLAARGVAVRDHGDLSRVPFRRTS